MFPLRLQADYNAIDLDEHVNAVDEINEVKDCKVGQVLFPSLGAPRGSSISKTAVSFSSANASLANSRTIATKMVI